MSLSALKLVRIGLLVALVIVAGMYGVRAGLNQPETRFDTLSALVVSTLVSGACVVDAKILKRQIVFIGQAALFFLWPIAVPIYMIWSRGWWGAVLFALFAVFLIGIIMISIAAATIATARF